MAHNATIAKIDQNTRPGVHTRLEASSHAPEHPPSWLSGADRGPPAGRLVPFALAEQVGPHLGALRRREHQGIAGEAPAMQLELAGHVPGNRNGTSPRFGLGGPLDHA